MKTFLGNFGSAQNFFFPFLKKNVFAFKEKFAFKVFVSQVLLKDFER